MEDYSGTKYLMLGFEISNKNLSGGGILRVENDTNPPAVLDLWVSEVGPGLGRSGQRSGKSQASSQV